MRNIGILTWAALIIGLCGPAAGAGEYPEERADSLFRIGEYQAALEEYGLLRWKDRADAELVFKRFLACEFRGGDCGKEERLDIYYAEKAGSPFLGIMDVYLRGRLIVSLLGMRKDAVPCNSVPERSSWEG